MVERRTDGRTLLRSALRKLWRRALGRRPAIAPAIDYHGLVVFDTPELDGDGMDIEPQYLRVLREFGVTRCDRAFEFCAGPGYIGYSLLAHGVCDALTLADVDPLAIEAATQTRTRNGLERRVNLFRSDGLDQVPATERWDLVVGNPPHFPERDPGDRGLLRADPGWALHRRFYADIGRFMTPGGLVVLAEASAGSTAEDFEPMVRAGGGTLVGSVLGTDFTGARPSGYYYLASRW